MHYKMNRIIHILFLIILFLNGNFIYSQYVKDTIYLEFEKNTGEEPFYRGVKSFSSEKGCIIFNLISKGSLLYSKEEQADTLLMYKLDLYTISTFKDVNQKVKDFRYKTYKISPPNENDKAYQFYNKNDIFETFLIEIINDKEFVVYPVSWRNQNIID